MDLAAGAPARAEVIRVDPTTTILVLTVHHIVFDGWSRRLLMAEITEIYQASMLGREPELVEPGHPADVLRADPEGDLADRIDAATRRLRGAPIGLPLPYDRPPVGESPLVSALAAISFDPDLTGRVMAAAAAVGCSSFMAATALLAGTLARASDQRDFLFAVGWPGRDDPATHHMVGMFMNMVVLRVGLSERTTWRELLRNARSGAIDAYVDGDVPLAEIVAALDAGRDISRPPLTPVLINLAEVPDDFDLAPGVRARYLPLDLMYSIWDLIMFVHMNESSGAPRLELSVDYARALFDHSTVTGLLEAMHCAATDLTDCPEDPVLETSTIAVHLDPNARLELVRSVWRDVLRAEEVDDDTGFFEAGGNSLLLAVLVEHLSKATGRTFTTMEVFRAGTVRGQAALLATPDGSMSTECGCR